MDWTRVYRLCKAVHHIYRHRETAMAFRDGDTSLLDQFNLVPEEREALVNHDFVALYRLGVHPVLVYHLSVVVNPREAYVKEIVPQLQGVPNPFTDYYTAVQRRIPG